MHLKKLADFTWATRHVLVPQNWPTSCRYFWRKPHSWLFLPSTKKVACIFPGPPSGWKRAVCVFLCSEAKKLRGKPLGRHFEEIRSGIHSQDLQTNPVLCQHHESYFIILYHHDRSLSSNFHTVWYFIILHPLSYIVKEYIIILYHTSSCLVMLFHVW